jgi:hypothetical protein
MKPNQRDIVAGGFRMDPVGEAVEREVNGALPYPFKFHKVNKIVVCLGPAPTSEKDYDEVLGVGLKQWPEFNLQQYLSLSETEKISALRLVVAQTFDWLVKTFPDAQFAETAKARLGWSD